MTKMSKRNYITTVIMITTIMAIIMVPISVIGKLKWQKLRNGIPIRNIIWVWYNFGCADSYVNDESDDDHDNTKII
jgi:hypothetical protein